MHHPTKFQQNQAVLGSFIDDSTIISVFRVDFAARSSQRCVDQTKPNLGRTCLFQGRFLVQIVEVRHFQHRMIHTFYSHKSWWSMLPSRLHGPKSWWSIFSSGAMAPAPLVTKWQGYSVIVSCTGLEPGSGTVCHTSTSFVGSKPYLHFFSEVAETHHTGCLLYTSPSPRDS